MKQYWTKLSLFYKTTVVTFVIIFTTLLLFVGVFQLFVGNFIDSYNASAFDRKVALVEKQIESGELSVEGLKKLEDDENLKLVLRTNGDSSELLYPVFENFIGEGYVESDSHGVTVIVDSMETPGSYAKELQVMVLNVPCSLSISYKVTMNATELSNILIRVFPYLLLVGFVISIAFSYLYARYQVRRIQKLKIEMQAMEDLSFPVNTVAVEGDEISDLQGKIYELYQSLRYEMDVIQNLEKDRELFMRGAIHELKTPIMLMNLQLQSLRKESNYEDEEEILADLQGRLHKMSRLVSEVLKISKLETLKQHTKITTQKFVEEVVEDYAYAMEDKELQLDLINESMDIVMSESEFKTLLSNVLGNAVKYSADKEKISLHIKDQTLQIRNTYNGSITEDIFQPFVRSQSDEDGDGLGLYIVKMLLAKYGYTYTYEIEYGIFEVTIHF